MVDLSVELGPLRLAHPVINASGTMDIFELSDALGPQILAHPPVAAYAPKTVTLKPREGNPAPRILETVGGMINAIGIPSCGLDVFVTEELPRLLGLPCPLILSIAGFSGDEYRFLATGLRDALDRLVDGDWAGRVGLELNVSCPNVHSGCASIGADTRETSDLVKTIRKTWPGLLVVKLTPNVTDIAAIGRVAAGAGADAIAAVNTYKGLVIDRETMRPYLGNVTGGLSGPAIKPLALRAVYELFSAVKVPIIGMGGIATVGDVMEFMSCGAMAVAVGSAGFREPGLAGVLSRQLAAALEERGLCLGELLGRAHQPL